ncbi:hypothetical protein SAMN05444420_1204 [Capnocytophaga granulosa]|uniref:Uncharacterized protein n=2 Tax=Capnocytophaga granulosa TaxID=45242 RepID=A0A1H2ZXT7_9FLAO|nr:hypothetical protein HMPREF9331_02455 [Capnocytophaga granulosa ATCC 51502]SDX22203.1 hypothetical protein SAMN05444420_1204 [Capnocytophaga granulosa]SUX93683.1 Uncharacterised protein [Capnocytophaga granulosa]
MNLSDFINFYKENLTTRGLMKKKYKAHYIIPIIYLLIPIILMGIKYRFGLDSFCSYIIFVMITIFDILFLILSTRRLIFKTMKELNKKFIVEKKCYSLNRQEIKKYFFSELKKYFNDKEISENKIKDIIVILNKKSEKEKAPFIISSSIFSAIALVIFSSACNRFYELVGNNPLDIIVYTILLTPFICYIVTYLIYSIREIYFNLFTNYLSINGLIDLLEEYEINKPRSELL